MIAKLRAWRVLALTIAYGACVLVGSCAWLTYLGPEVYRAHEGNDPDSFGVLIPPIRLWWIIVLVVPPCVLVWRWRRTRTKAGIDAPAA